jgi:hypothetical protein
MDRGGERYINFRGGITGRMPVLLFEITGKMPVLLFRQ